MSRPKSAPTRSAAGPQLASAVDSFRRIVRALRLAAKRGEAQAGLSAAQLFVLRQLAEASARSVTELGERTLTDRSTVSVVVDRLRERGLVVRDVSADDRRRSTVQITSRGRAVLRRAPEPPTARLIAALRSLDDEQLRQLESALRAVTAHMGVAAGPAGMLFDDREAPRARTRSARRSRPYGVTGYDDR